MLIQLILSGATARYLQGFHGLPAQFNYNSKYDVYSQRQGVEKDQVVIAVHYTVTHRPSRHSLAPI